VGLLFALVQSKHPNSLFRYRSKTTETNCFETNLKKPKKTKKPKKPKKNEKNRKNPKFSVKNRKYAPYQTVSVGLLFASVQSKHRHSLFRYRSETTETNALFRIVPKLASVRVLVV
jgi:hypothetical protein